MLKNISGWFSPSRHKRTGDTDNSVFPPAFLVQLDKQSVAAEKLDSLFFSRMLGANSQIERQLNHFENAVIKGLDGLLLDNRQVARLLPRLPAVLPRVLTALRDEHTSASRLADLIREDPVLVGEVIRMTNSPYFRTRESITSLKHATVMLGRDGMRRLVASAILKPLLNPDSGHFVRLSSRPLWDHAEKTAVVASLLCRHDDQERFHAYLAGILLNVGFTVGFQLLDQLFDGSESPNSGQFLQLLVSRCRQLSLLIAEIWDIPAQICNAFDAQARPHQVSSAGNLAIQLYLADRIAKTRMLQQMGLLTSSQPIMLLINGGASEACLAGLDAVQD